MTDLAPVLTYGALDLTDTPYLLEWGADLGAPETVYTLLETLLQDGEAVSADRKSNRVLTIPVLVEGTDMEELAAAEAALIAEADKPLNTLVFDPGDGWGPATVFDTFTAQVAFDRDEGREQAMIRRYILTVPALPFTRSADKTTTTAVPVPTSLVETTVDACTSTSGWTASDSGPTVVSGALQTVKTLSDAWNGYTVWLRKTGTITLTDAATPFLRVDYTAVIATGQVRLLLDGVSYSPVATVGSQVWFTGWAAGTYSTLEVRYIVPARPPVGRPITTGTLTVADVTRTNMAGVVGTRRQALKTIDVGGSVRSPGDLQVYHATNGLGSVLLYTYPADLLPWSPVLQPFRTGGPSITTDSNRVSGGWSWMNSAVTYTIPQDKLPAGHYELLARVMSDSTAGVKSITWTATVGSTTVTGTAKVTIDAINVYQTVSLDMIALPPVALLPGSTDNVVITLQDTGVLRLDSAWLFHTDGALTWCEAGAELSVTASTPTLDTPHPMVYAGSRYAGPGVQAWGSHEFTPPQVAVFAVTADTLDATIELSHYRCWHTHAGT